MDFGIIANPYKNENSDRVRYIGDYHSITHLHASAREILANRDNWACSSTKFYKYSQSALRGLDYFKKESELRSKAITGAFLKYRENNRNIIAAEYAPDYRVTGQVVDMGRVLNGEPECMIDMFADVATHHKYLDIEIRIESPSWTRTHKGANSIIFAYYLGFLDLIDTWEQSGIRCRITANTHTCADGLISANQYIGSVMIKDYDSILDLETICDALILSSVRYPLGALGYATIGHNPEKLLSAYNPDYRNISICNFNPMQPNKVIIPSLWFPFRNNFKRIPAVEILQSLGYPLSTY